MRRDEARRLATKAEGKARTVGTLLRAGVVRPVRPDRLVRTLVGLRAWGPTPAGGYFASATRYPDAPGIIDDSGRVSFREIHEQTNALARAFAARGIGVGGRVAIM